MKYHAFNDKGKRLCEKWHKIYQEENKRLQKELNDPNYWEGWIIIESERFVKTLEDTVGLLLQGYDTDAIHRVREWIEEFGEYESYFGYTHKAILNELKRYYKDFEEEYEEKDMERFIITLDGKKFKDSEVEIAKKHEDKYLAKLQQEYTKIVCFEGDDSVFDIGVCAGVHIDVVKFSTLEDVNRFNNYFDTYKYRGSYIESYGEDLKPTRDFIGKKLIVSFGFDGDYIEILGTTDFVKNRFLDAINGL